MNLSLKLKVILVIGIIVGASMGIAGALWLFNYDRSSLRLGALSGDLHHLPLFIALEKGFFKDEGLDLNFEDVLWFSNGNEVMVAFETGTLDVAYLGLAPAMAHKLTQNAPIKVISGVNVNGSAIVISSSSSINNISDLLNKKIAVPSLNNMQDFILQIALTNAGLTTDNLTRVTMSVGNMETALYTGDIDGFVAWEPFNAKAIDNLGAKILLNSSEVWPNHPCCVIAATNSLIIDKPSIVEKIVKIHKRALEWISNPNNHNEIVQIAKKYTGITSDNTIEMALANIGYVYNFTSYMTEIEKFYDNLTVLNDNIPAWPSGREAFFTEFFNSEFLDA